MSLQGQGAHTGPGVSGGLLGFPLLAACSHPTHLCSHLPEGAERRTLLALPTETGEAGLEGFLEESQHLGGEGSGGEVVRELRGH